MNRVCDNEHLPQELILFNMNHIKHEMIIISMKFKLNQISELKLNNLHK